MRFIKSYIVLLLLIFLSCSTSFESISNDVQLSISSNNLVIRNHTDENIYYFAVEQQILALINWAPSTSGPVIMSRKSLKIPFSEIFNGSRIEPVKSGDKIVVYWWTDTLQDFNDVRFEIIAI